MYPAAIQAPQSARKSPRKAVPPKKDLSGGQEICPACHVQASLNPTTTPPVRARTRPITAAVPIFSRNTSGESSATHSGVVVTRTTELATVVYSRDVIQVAKCSAKKTPESSASSHSPRPSARSSDLERVSANGASTRLASVRRAAAMTMDGAPAPWARRMKMEAVETARIPPSRPRVRTERRIG